MIYCETCKFLYTEVNGDNEIHYCRAKPPTVIPIPVPKQDLAGQMQMSVNVDHATWPIIKDPKTCWCGTGRETDALDKYCEDQNQKCACMDSLAELAYDVDSVIEHSEEDDE